MKTNSREFKKLQDEWYGKLKKKGFTDIETKNGRLDVDKTLNNIVTNYNQDTFEQKQDYYRLAGFFLHDYGFKYKYDRVIWEEHSNGVSIRDIVKILKRKNCPRISGYAVCRREVHQRLLFLKEEMKKFYEQK